ncbi:MAG: hypothetical protein AB1758_34240, partial [Candidatus Eremiobacterota bacterium]
MIDLNFLQGSIDRDRAQAQCHGIVFKHRENMGAFRIGSNMCVNPYRISKSATDPAGPQYPQPQPWSDWEETALAALGWPVPSRVEALAGQLD